MQGVRDVLFYKLIESEEFDFVLAPVNIVLIALVVIATIWLIRFSRKYLDTINDFSNKINLGDRNDTLYRLFRQLIYLLALAMIIQSFSINNAHIRFETFLDTKLFGVKQFELKIFNILLIIILFFVTRVVVDLLRLYLQRNLSKKDWVDEGKEYTILQVVRYIVYTIAVIVIIRSTGLSISLILSAAAAFFVAVGLGLQRIFSDFVSGFILMFDGSVRVGDVIEHNGEPAKVSKINIRTSLIETLDASLLVVPNSELTTRIIETRNKFKKNTRFNIRVTVQYGTDTNLVKELLVAAGKDHPNVSKKPKPSVWMRDFGANGLVLDLFIWTSKPFSIELTRSDIRFEIDRLFREHNIKIPFPQRDVHLYQKPVDL